MIQLSSLAELALQFVETHRNLPTMEERMEAAYAEAEAFLRHGEERLKPDLVLKPLDALHELEYAIATHLQHQEPPIVRYTAAGILNIMGENKCPYYPSSRSLGRALKALKRSKTPLIDKITTTNGITQYHVSRAGAAHLAARIH